MTQSVARGQAEVPEWTFADRLRKARSRTGLSQKKFAAVLQVNDSAYSQWEADNNKPRDIVAVANRIAMLTGISSAWLLGAAESPTGDPDGPNGGATLPRLDSNQKPSGSGARTRFNRVSWSEPMRKAA
jgi:transcriptional regulator with XRE-family HTH domain